MSGPYPYAGYGGAGYPPIQADPTHPGAPASGGPPAPRTPGTDTPPSYYAPTAPSAPTAPATYPPAYPGQSAPATGAYPVPAYNGGVPPPSQAAREYPAYPPTAYPPQSGAPAANYPPYGVPYPPQPAGQPAYQAPAAPYPAYPQVAPPAGGTTTYPSIPGDQSGSRIYGQPTDRRPPVVGGYQPYPAPTPAPAPATRPQQVAAPATVPGGYPGQRRPEHQGPRKKALVIGCNYPGTNAELKGCINDAQYMKHMLMTKFKFQEENIRVMTDDQGGPLRPTRRNIFAGFQWLVQGAHNGDRLFLHFSGHGSQKKDWSGEEKDGFNETLLPTDYRTEGQIIDDEVNIKVVNPLPHGVVLHCVIDACHSGTAMDLQYYTKCKQGRFEWKDNYGHRKPARTKGTAGGIAFQFGACKDSQVAQDTAELGGTNSGAATYSFIEAIEMGGVGQSYGQILCHMQKSMDKLAKINGDNMGGGVVGALLQRVVGIGKQTPQLSCSTRIDLAMPLMI